MRISRTSTVMGVLLMGVLGCGGGNDRSGGDGSIPPGGDFSMDDSCLESCPGACRSNVCVDAPTQLAQLESHSEFLSADDAQIYYVVNRCGISGTDGKTIFRRFSFASMTSETVAELEDCSTAFAMADGALYYSAGGSHGIHRLDPLTGQDTPLAESLPDFDSADEIYFGGSSLFVKSIDHVYSLPRSGGAVTMLPLLHASFSELAVAQDGQTLFELTGALGAAGTHAIYRASGDGSNEALLTGVTDQANRMLLTSSALHWIEGDTLGDSWVVRMAPTGGTVEQACYKGVTNNFTLDRDTIITSGGDQYWECAPGPRVARAVWSTPYPLVPAGFGPPDSRIILLRDGQTEAVSVWRLPPAP